MGAVYFFLGLTMGAIIVEASLNGCGKSPPSNGRHTIVNQGRTREYYVNLPSGYTASTPTPLVVMFHGWGYSGREWYDGSGWGARSMTPTSNTNGFILVSPTGLTDSSLPGNCDNAGGYCSWNAAGTTGSPGPEGETCNLKKMKDSTCYYDTCLSGCKDKCWWTTCNDDTSFVHALLDKLETELCVDVSRVYAGGESNGGMMAWQMATDSRAARFAAFVATIGLPAHGFNFRPSDVPMPIMGIWGSTDRTIPHGNNKDLYTESSDGYYYTTAHTITQDWADAHGCDIDSKVAYPTTKDGQNNLACTSFSKNCRHGVAPVVDCRFTGGHVVQSWVPALAWEFFAKHQRIVPGFVAPPLPKKSQNVASEDRSRPSLFVDDNVTP